LHNPSAHRRDALPITMSAEQPDAPACPKFEPGAVVREKEMASLGHTRLPRYIRGKQGVGGYSRQLFSAGYPGGQKDRRIPGGLLGAL
jgi:hypothetical protein